MQEEYELIQYPLIPYLNVFINRIIYRRPHRHDETEFCVCLEGNSKWQILGQLYEVSPGDFLILNPNTLHEIKGKEKGSTFIFVQFSYEIFNAIFPEIKNLIFDQSVVGENKDILKTSLIEFSKQYFVSSQKDFFKVLSGLFALFDKVLHNVSHHYMNLKEQTSYNFKMERISRLVDFVEKNFKQNITLSDFAINEGISLAYASRFIKENLNMTFQDYVKELRFNEAKKLMLLKNKNLSTISFEAGFSDPRYLKEVFEEKLAMSPSEYRKDNFIPGDSEQKYNPLNSEHIFTRQESAVLLNNKLSF